MGVARSGPSDRAGWLQAVLTCGLLAAVVSFPAWWSPGTALPCHIIHPDCAGNQWLLAWVAEQLAAGQGLLHNARYYWPVGDAPFLAGNGGEGVLYLPLHLLLGWPVAGNLFVVLLLVGNGLAAVYAARGAGASWPGALLAGATLTLSVHGIRELSSGRVTQGDLVWMLLFLGAWLRFLDRPVVGRGVLAGGLLGVTSVLYWYHGWFMILAGGVLLLGRRLEGPVPWRPLVVFGGAFLLVVIGPLAWYLAHWHGLPGTAEAAFPHPEAVQDGLQLQWPFLVRDGRFVGQALPALVVVLAAAQAARLLLRRSRRPALDGALLLAWGLFLVLAMGPGFRILGVSPYEAVYGLAAPLRRFWWPSRQVVVATVALTLLAARAVPEIRSRLGAAALGLGLAAAVPACLLAQGPDFRLSVTRMPSWPPPFYATLAELPGQILLDLPLSPRAAVSQKLLLFQRVHGKTLLTGHGLWVDRVRPSAWDAFVEGNSFLRALRAVDDGSSTGTVAFDPQDLAALQEQGLTVVVLNAEQYAIEYQQAVNRQYRLLAALFGRPVATMARAWAWDLGQWRGAFEVEIPPWVPPAAPPDGAVPTALRSAPSAIFQAPGRGWSKAAPPRQAERTPTR